MIFPKKISESHKEVGVNGECLYIAFTKLSMFFFVPHRFWKEHSNIDVEKESLEAISALTFFDTQKGVGWNREHK